MQLLRPTSRFLVEFAASTLLGSEIRVSMHNDAANVNVLNPRMSPMVQKRFVFRIPEKSQLKIVCVMSSRVSEHPHASGLTFC
eukprot:3940413-Rhodomonas_salina.1